MQGIKTEYQLVCHGCLCNDRRMSPLGENSELFWSLVGNKKSPLLDSNEIKLCWECNAKLKKFKEFQMQLIKVQDVLLQFLYGLETTPESLSKLTTTKCTNNYEVQQEKTKKKGKKHCNSDSSNAVLLKELDIKAEITSADLENDENTPETVHADSIINNVSNNDKTNDIKDDLDDYMDGVSKYDDFDNGDGIMNDFEEKPVTFEKKGSKEHTGFQDISSTMKSKITNKGNWKTYANTRSGYVKLVETKQVEWGDIKSYFTVLYLDEKDMEATIFVKERNYSDYRKYPYSCTRCRLGYKSQVDLRRHNNLNHRKPGTTNKCSLCHKVLPSQADLESHWREHTPIAKCNMCNHLMRPRGMKQHLNLAHTKRYSCCSCNMMFETLTAFGAHYRETHMMFTCDYCRKVFKTKSRIAFHIRNMHIPAFCGDCNRSYLNRSQYLKHCVLLHPQRANITEVPSEACFCVECDKQFRSVAQYRKHLKVSTKHIEVKRQRVPCPECGKIFARKMYMKNHYNLYHLKKTQFYCEICDKYFARGFGLRVHNKHVHEKVQPVRDKICDLCGRAFSTNRIMLNHRRTHTGERPHKCPYCTAEYIQKYAMQTHVRTQHKQFT